MGFARIKKHFNKYLISGVALVLLAGTANAINYDTGTTGRFAGDIQNNYIDDGLRAMSRELSNVMMHHASIIGMFFDAKQQLETQQNFQRLSAEAHKDYHPSETMCRFGTFVRSVANTERKAALDKQILSQNLTNIYAQKHGASGETEDTSYLSRIEHFKKTYCDVNDNNGALSQMCTYDDGGTTKIGAEEPARINNDIDFARVVAGPLTLGINYINDGTPDTESSDSEEDVMAMARHLYRPDVFKIRNKEDIRRYSALYQRARRMMAMHTVAHNSFASLIAAKAESPEAADPSKPNGPHFMKILMKEFGFFNEDGAADPYDQADQVTALLGENPSYYAQMEVLTKKMYQSPDFYTNLYDKPANVDRIGASMEAIKVMQMRDTMQSALRREMLLSLMVERRVNQQIRDLSAGLNKL